MSGQAFLAASVLALNQFRNILRLLLSLQDFYTSQQSYQAQPSDLL